MITTKDNIRADEVEQNEPTLVRLGRRMIKVRITNNTVARRFDRYTAEAEMSYNEAGTQLTLNMNNNRDLVPKCVSLIILHSWFKVTFFHWIYWRYLDRHYSQAELGEPLQAGLSLGEGRHLLKNLLFLQDNSQMIRKMTQGIIRNTIAAPKSEPETTL